MGRTISLTYVAAGHGTSAKPSIAFAAGEAITLSLTPTASTNMTGKVLRLVISDTPGDAPLVNATTFSFVDATVGTATFDIGETASFEWATGNYNLEVWNSTDDILMRRATAIITANPRASGNAPAYPDPPIDWSDIENVPSTTVGLAFFGLTNPGAVRYVRINANNSVDALSASDFRTAIGAGTSSFSGAYGDLSGKPPITFAENAGTAGQINISGGVETATSGGIIAVNGGSGSGANGGNISTEGGGGADANGGAINTSGGDSASANGGAINTSGASLPGGSVFTSNGGGSINTGGTGEIQFGVDGTRTTVAGSATANRTQTLPDKSGTFAMTSDISGGGATNEWIPAGAMIPRVTNGPGVNASETSTNKSNYETLDFDTTTQEYAQFWLVMPSNYGGGTVTARFFWTADSGSGTVQFQLAGRALSDDDSIDTARGTAVGVSDTLIAAGDLHRTAATGAITIAGSPAAGGMVLFEVSRDVASDTLGVDARLLGVEVSF
jgi:hypothetical protein